MTEASDETVLGQGGGWSTVKKIAPWVLLALVGFKVWTLYGQFQSASLTYESDFLKPKSGLIATPTAGADGKGSATAAPSKPVDQVEALTAVNVHKDASASSETIWVLDEGKRVPLVDQVGPWYKVRDSKGRVGWVTAGQRYTKVVKAK